MKKRFTILTLIFLASVLTAQENTLKKDELKSKIQSEIAKIDGKIALAFRDLSNPQNEILINEQENFHAASTMKTPVMIEVYRQSALGKFNLNDSVVVKNEFKSIVDGSPYSLSIDSDGGEALYKYIGSKKTIYSLVYEMITVSSNLATNLLIDLVDAKNVQKTMLELGAQKIKVLRGVEDQKAYEKGLNNTTTAYDLMLIFSKIANDEVVSTDACKEMIKILLDQKFNRMIPALLPKEVKVAHKTGSITGVKHDSGIVFLPDGRKYVLVILSKELKDDTPAEVTLSGISKLIYNYMINNKVPVKKEQSVKTE
ncbi:MAG: serine hydrolase [Bacillota bacterium]